MPTVSKGKTQLNRNNPIMNAGSVKSSALGAGLTLPNSVCRVFGHCFSTETYRFRHPRVPPGFVPAALNRGFTHI